MHHEALAVAAFLGALLAGFLFAFAVVVMPGIRGLPDREFVLAFQRIDGVIQAGSPLFAVVWIGSAAVLAAAAVLATLGDGGATAWWLAAAVAMHLLAVQAPTLIVNIPLNNALQAVDVDTADDATLRATREAFEDRWNRWNRVRTVVACFLAAALIGLLHRPPA